MTSPAHRKTRQPGSQRQTAARPLRRWPDGRFRPRRRRRVRCLCGEFATHTLTVQIDSAASTILKQPRSRRARRPVWTLLRLCDACYAAELEAHNDHSLSPKEDA